LTWNHGLNHVVRRFITTSFFLVAADVYYQSSVDFSRVATVNIFFVSKHK